MDWSKAKTILIITFLLLDLFLGYQVMMSQNRDMEIAPQGELIPSSLEELLKTRNIKLETEIPTEMPPEMNYVNVRFTSFASHLQKLTGQIVGQQGVGVTVKFNKPLLLTNLINKEELLKKVERYIAYSQDYTYDKKRSSKTLQCYVQQYGKYPIFSAPLEIMNDRNRMLGYRQIHVQIVNQGTGRKIIPAFTAIRTLLDNGYIRYGEAISDVTVGYFGHMYDADIQVLAPVWRVVHTGGIQYVNGITGAIEQAPPLEKNQAISNNNTSGIPPS
ncbi:two-component system regulatory protein YycI [Aneurinibacillus thermoaerophilus]|uniref:Two-component system regulatory protein YycI n=1 Tax=Aneurinibacillus thermoaerophilus TaxID=143495 RepID=A0ABX8YBT8_ANETH|nr:two-component system regulatory protein YycI [Aneurinibacillus thermoaerophilus]MED0675342.1 two-component system regulatory protein YycI [Aneurinibacillus thermoaerophilus]MED0679147.1 two-component system regulatory protein YycI [Aneurinibacillus thermoaerophilus]MED0738277.1 two-component system regulatory protein YycI [Aneurinibacillus thermoaerophilus]MED0765934.1 two-component system regulatory protein YycI [Aneurinibacillus thermoaerophilus]QYY42784.1 two-component system regulatory 